MKTYGGVDVEIFVSLTLALVGGERVVSRPCRHWIEGWVDLGARLDDMEKLKFLTHVQPIASHSAEYTTVALIIYVLNLRKEWANCPLTD
jgi:hypothetical protein